MQKEGMCLPFSRGWLGHQTANPLRAVAAERLRDYWHCQGITQPAVKPSLHPDSHSHRDKQITGNTEHVWEPKSLTPDYPVGHPVMVAKAWATSMFSPPWGTGHLALEHTIAPLNKCMHVQTHTHTQTLCTHLWRLNGPLKVTYPPYCIRAELRHKHNSWIPLHCGPANPWSHQLQQSDLTATDPQVPGGMLGPWSTSQWDSQKIRGQETWWEVPRKSWEK